MRVSLELFSVFIYSWSMQTFELTDALIKIDLTKVCNDLDVYLGKLFKITFWKQGRTKIIEWLIGIYNSYLDNGLNTIEAANIKSKY